MERTLLTLAVVATIALSFLGMWIGWRRKQNREVAPIQTALPTGSKELTEPVLARFAGSTTSGNWLDRVTNYGLGTPRGITFQIFETGIFIQDEHQPETFKLWIPKSDIQSSITKRGIAGDVVEKNGMIIVTWKLGDLLLDTGVRVSRHADHELIVNELRNFPVSTDSNGFTGVVAGGVNE